jgi:uncharacterized protein (TIGR02246 family)
MVAALITRADGAFAAGDAERYGALFADDARLMLLHREAVEGQAAIVETWRDTFTRLDTSDWQARTELLEIHGDRAYAFATYTERLVKRADRTRLLVRGRLVYWLRREPGGDWQIVLLMNSHSHPVEPIE